MRHTATFLCFLQPYSTGMNRPRMRTPSTIHLQLLLSLPLLSSRAREEKPAGGSGLALSLPRCPVVKALAVCDFCSLRQDGDSSARLFTHSQLGFFAPFGFLCFGVSGGDSQQLLYEPRKSFDIFLYSCVFVCFFSCIMRRLLTTLSAVMREK